MVKSNVPVTKLKFDIRQDAEQLFPVTSIVKKYMDCIEEIINSSLLVQYFNELVRDGRLSNILDEIIRQSKVEFYIYDE